MSKFFTSDLHLNSTNVNVYSKRPFTSAEHAAEQLVKNINSVCTNSDVLIHVGDFILTSPDRHGKFEDIPIDVKPETYISDIKSRLILLAGNHDDNHSVEADAISLNINLNHKWRNVYVNHYPSNHRWYNGPQRRSKKKIIINLCGHVHERWMIMYDRIRGVLNYNVGIDVHKYKPVKDSDITLDLDFIFDNGFNVKPYFGEANFTWTNKDYEQFKLEVNNYLKSERLKRKLRRYEKKGLTEAECARRREEALKLKGKVIVQIQRNH